MSWTTTRGKKSTPPLDPTAPPRRRANKRKGHGTYANDRPPIISLISRETGEQRLWVCDHANTRTCAVLIAENIPMGSTCLYTDEWQRSRGSHPCHAPVRHGVHEWARDNDGDGQREVHCNTCEGAGASLRTYLRAFRGVHTRYLHLYVATYEVMVNTKRVTPTLIQRMCVHGRSVHSSYT
jgi:transposase